jgi:nucleoid-associated protein YgaU
MNSPRKDAGPDARRGQKSTKGWHRAALAVFLAGVTGIGLAGENWELVRQKLPPGARAAIEGMLPEVAGTHRPAAGGQTAEPAAPSATIELPAIPPLEAPPAPLAGYPPDPPDFAVAASAPLDTPAPPAPAATPEPAPSVATALVEPGSADPAPATTGQQPSAAALPAVPPPASDSRPIDGTTIASEPVSYAPESGVEPSGPPPGDLLAAARESVAAGSAGELQVAQTGAPQPDAASPATGAPQPVVPPSLDAERSKAAGPDVLIGKSQPSARITVRSAGETLGTTTSDAAGGWTLQLGKPLAPGARRLEITQELPGGGPASPPASVDLMVPQASGAPTPEAGSEAAGPETPASQDLVDKAGEMAAAVSKKVTEWFGGGESPEETAAPIGAPDPLAFSAATYTALGPQSGRVTLSGRAPPARSVRFRIDGEAAGSAVAADNGRFLHNVDRWLAVGEHSAEAEVLKEDGSLELSAKLAFPRIEQPADRPDAPAQSAQPGTAPSESPGESQIAGAATAPLPQASPQLSIAAIRYEPLGPKQGRVTVEGTASPDSEVRILADGSDIGIARPGADGRYRFESDTWLRPGRHDIVVERIATTGEAAERIALTFDNRSITGETAAPAETGQPPAASDAAPPESQPETASPPKRQQKAAKRARKAAARHASARRSLLKKRKRHAAAASVRRLKKQRRTVNVLRGGSVERVLVPQSSRKKVRMPHVSARSASRPRLYTIRRGDTLWALARRHLGDGRRYREIHTLNRKRIRNPNRIRAGQRIILP